MLPPDVKYKTQKNKIQRNYNM